MRVPERTPQGYDYVLGNGGLPLAVKRATGEVTDAITAIIPIGSIIYTPEDLDAINERKKQQAEFFEQAERLKTLGNFSFVFANQQFKDVSPETAARLIFLSTYLQYGCDSLFATQRTPINRTNLPKIMRLSAATISRFLKESTPQYIHPDDRGNLCMNTLLFCHGKIGRHGESKSYRKIYIEAVRKLYRDTPASKHKQLGYIFQMLPFINIEYNVLCHNPFEKDLDNVQRMTEAEFCEQIGYSYNAVSRLKNTYRHICFDIRGRTETFCAFVDNGHGTGIFINPNILYCGSRPDRVEVLASFCKVSQSE